MRLDSSVETIKGVGPETAKRFTMLGVETVYDLLTFWPRRYEDYSEIVLINDMKPGAVTVKARLESIKTKRVRRGLHITEAVIRDESSAVRVVWFNQPYREKYFKSGKEYYFSGLYDFSYNRYVLQNPSVEEDKEFTKNTARIVPVYQQTKGLDSRQIRSALAECVSLFKTLGESLPAEIIEEHDLITFAEAAKQLHWPESQEALQQARDRVGFEEVFAYILAGKLSRQEHESEVALQIQFDEQKAKEYVELLPFTLTPAQKQAAWEILKDIDKEHPMNRLLEGDVGAGKTVVATFAAVMAAHNGVQTAFMAPTELLARQHARTLADLLENTGVSVALLTSAVKARAKSTLKAQLESGDVDIVVGTHALLQDSVKFKRLGLVVVDEQHRFGVKQRQKLVDKAGKVPHILSMTATPIPRSLALTVYGELDISIIASKPSNRLPIETYIWSPNSMAQLYDSVEDELRVSRQAFVICPLIEESDESKSVLSEAKKLQKTVFKDWVVEPLHGKMPDEDKAMIMQKFADGKIDVLVSTTVIEVGIDVPNATVMIIEGADQYGLAQLHQLRGRVGRGEHQAYCYLIPSSSQKPSKRLRAMETARDGFKLAELDLEIRGPGAIYGARQHGKLDLKIANIPDVDLIKRARDSAELFVSDYTLDKFPVLAERVQSALSLTYLN